MCGGGMQAGDDKTNAETAAENTNTNTNTGNGNNNFAGQNIDATNRPVKGQTPFSACLLYTSPSPRDLSTSRMPSSA